MEDKNKQNNGNDKSGPENDTYARVEHRRQPRGNDRETKQEIAMRSAEIVINSHIYREVDVSLYKSLQWHPSPIQTPSNRLRLKIATKWNIKVLKLMWGYDKEPRDRKGDSISEAKFSDHNSMNEINNSLHAQVAEGPKGSFVALKELEVEGKSNNRDLVRNITNMWDGDLLIATDGETESVKKTKYLPLKRNYKLGKITYQLFSEIREVKEGLHYTSDV
ncbi:hypothetical protein GWI33_013558 [Rhynchophorus ferrugineus]|uniref:Uncharacterized protein n=1 Tax=Rhynchophorus ferrugineus TaxID=354439 RepID=A0A834I681_RHYFE|nr:hypothetical protein GWI33_013558 [Rhynchophorus ferrugineus]